MERVIWLSFIIGETLIGVRLVIVTVVTKEFNLFIQLGHQRFPESIANT